MFGEDKQFPKDRKEYTENDLVQLHVVSMPEVVGAPNPVARKDHTAPPKKERGGAPPFSCGVPPGWA